MSTDTLNPAYRIQTQRLVLRCWSPTDAPLLTTALTESIDHLKPWLPFVHEEPKTLQQRVEWLRQSRAKFDLNENWNYGIFNLDETLVLGGTGLHPRVGKGAIEIGYWIHAHHINQGIATEVAAALTKVAFEIHHLTRVEIHCYSHNHRSAAVPQKLGFTHEATLRDRLEDHNDTKHDSMIWSLFASDYPTSKPAQTEMQAFDAIGQQLF